MPEIQNLSHLINGKKTKGLYYIQHILNIELEKRYTSKNANLIVKAVEYYIRYSDVVFLGNY